MQGEQETEVTGGWTMEKRDREGVWGHTRKSRLEGSGTSRTRMGIETCRQQVWAGRKTWKCVRSWVAELSRQTHGDLVSPAVLPWLTVTAPFPGLPSPHLAQG